MSEEMKNKEEAVFAEEVNNEELKQVTAGMGVNQGKDDCTEMFRRDIYKGGFPNCAATVGSGSWCNTNDACKITSIAYYNMKGCFVADCQKAWE